MTHRIKDGWRLYYSDEGYPYYFNEVTGESQWAELPVTDSGHEQTESSTTKELPIGKEGSGSDDEAPGSESDEEGLESGASTDSRDSTFDEAFNEKFKAFLRTPEGMEAVLAEQERIEKFVEKKSKKMQDASDREYVKKLLVNKKNDGEVRGGGGGLFDALGSFLGIRDSSGTSKTPKEPIEGSSNDRAGSSGDAKQRGRKRSPSSNSSKDGADLEGGLSPSASRASSSSDLESLSSEDSDVAVINAPVLSELPSWLQPEALYGRLVAPVHDYLTRHGVISGAAAVGDYVGQRGYELGGVIGERSLALAQQGGVVVGTALVQWTVLTWDTLQPYIIHFMETVIDVPIASPGGARRVDDAATATAAADQQAIALEGGVPADSDSGTNNNAVAEDVWKTLPPAAHEEDGPEVRPPLPPGVARPLDPIEPLAVSSTEDIPVAGNEV